MMTLVIDLLHPLCAAANNYFTFIETGHYSVADHESGLASLSSNQARSWYGCGMLRNGI